MLDCVGHTLGLRNKCQTFFLIAFDVSKWVGLEARPHFPPLLQFHVMIFRVQSHYTTPNMPNLGMFLVSSRVLFGLRASKLFDFFLKFAACSCRYLYQRCFSTVNSYLKIAPWGLLLTSQCSLDISSTECRATFLRGVCRRWDCRSFLPCVWAEAWGCIFFGHWNCNLVRLDQ